MKYKQLVKEVDGRVSEDENASETKRREVNKRSKFIVDVLLLAYTRRLECIVSTLLCVRRIIKTNGKENSLSVVSCSMRFRAEAAERQNSRV